MEDMVILGNGTVLWSELNSLRSIFARAHGAAVESGSVWTLRVEPGRGPGELAKVPMHNWPAGTVFRPHGLGLLGEQRLFVINHAYNRGGERVDVFDIEYDPSGAVALHWVNWVDISDITIGRANDVVPVGPDEFYFTVWVPFSDPITGLLFEKEEEEEGGRKQKKEEEEEENDDDD